MIPSSSIALSEDGRQAWWVVRECDCDHRVSVGCHKTLRRADQSCDACGGDSDRWFRLGGSPCPDCDGTGRHTFTIEVEHHDAAYMTYQTGEPGTRTFRVSVVPGMVVPIVDNDAPEWYERSDHHIGMGQDENAEYNGRIDTGTEPGYVRDVILPPDARPGMWAVQLQIVHT
jgi:hypothetical protein